MSSFVVCPHFPQGDARLPIGQHSLWGIEGSHEIVRLSGDRYAKPLSRKQV